MMYEIPSEWVEATGYLAPYRRTIYGGDCMRRLAMLCGAIAMAALAGDAICPKVFGYLATAYERGQSSVHTQKWAGGPTDEP